MTRVAKQLAFGCVIGGLVFLWSAQRGLDQVVAQQRGPTVTRMFTGPDGLTHFEEVPMPAGFAKVAGVQFSDRRGAATNARVSDWHPAPHRRYVVTLSGRAEIVGSAGNKLFIADRDHILLAEDLTGKGHTTKAIDWVTMFVEIDQPRTATPSN